jgi:hypothetical protein
MNGFTASAESTASACKRERGLQGRFPPLPNRPTVDAISNQGFNIPHGYIDVNFYSFIEY